MAQDNTGKNKMWYTGEVQHEGFPLQLRFPEKPDFDSLQAKYPKLLTVTHTFDKVKPSGMPEADYNESLADFDHEMITAFVQSSSGLTILVETFGGRRNYYMYISASAPLEDVKKHFTSKYPQHQLNWDIRDDQGWKFIRRYSEEYKFYKKT